MDIGGNNKEDKKNWFFADLHLHSRFSRACSKELNLDNLAKWGKIKGLNLLGTGDFTHPVWMKEIKEKLVGNGRGFYEYNGFLFIITGEISLIYTQNGKGRKVHLNILVPNFEIADKINEYIDNKGFRRDYDGRPIFGMSCEEFVKDVSKIDDKIEIIPAHIWTPYFGVFGSMSGFDSLKEAFLSEVSKIHAIETGISSDIPMNLKIKELRDKSIVSFSDSHSFWPWRLGREATIFKKTDSYNELIRQIRENDFFGTIETEPAYGKYHWDGHVKCNFSCSPEESKKLKGICPKCGRRLTIGVENRVESLAENLNEAEGKMFYSILPLHEILSLYYGVGMNSKKIWNVYWNIIKEFENEFNILLNVSREELFSKDVEEKLVDLIIKNREGKIKVKPGYDGVYGEAILDSSREKQSKLF
jgi:uncharacterized protein (TIGR00375 family)